jgi:regulator of extracellular matrix RemA (YlzA/DUF370 family)
MIHIGHNNFVVADHVVAIISPNSAPVKRLRDEAKESGHLVDATKGNKVRAVLIMTSKHVILAAHEVQTLTEKFNEAYLSQTPVPKT